MTKVHEKDPAARALYGFDWGPLLGPDDVIETSTWTGPVGLVLDDSDHDDTTTSVFVAGGTVGDRFCVVNHITTQLGRIDERSKVIIIRNR